MLTGRQLHNLLRQHDAALNRLEQEALQVLLSAVKSVTVRLENELRALYNNILDGTASAGAAVREAQVRMMLEQLDIMRFRIGSHVVTEPLESLVTRSYREGRGMTARMLRRYGTEITLSGLIPVETAVRAANAAARLTNHSTEFARTAERFIIEGIIEGRSWRDTTRLLARETSKRLYETERIVRTESVWAADEARRDAYRETGIGYVQRIAVLDDRVCEFCAARAGRIYRVDDAPAALHPFCRCFNAPIKREWVDEGLVDLAWVDEHAAAVKAESRRVNGRVARVNTRAPFERLNNQRAPRPVALRELR